MFDSVDATMVALARQRYAAARETATAVYLALELGKPLFVEGAHGTGKTALAMALAAALEEPVIRLRCFAGMDPERSAFSWDYAARMKRMGEEVEKGARAKTIAGMKVGEFVVPGPLLKAISPRSGQPVLLIDNFDAAGAAFAAYLADFLETQALEVPGAGVVRAAKPPRVVVASRGDVPAVLAGQVQYAALEFPEYGREVDILHSHVPGLGSALAGEVCNFVAAIRRGKFTRKPGVGETLDWARALATLRRVTLDEDTVNETVGCILKHPADIRRFRDERFFEQVVQQRLDVAG